MSGNAHGLLNGGTATARRPSSSASTWIDKRAALTSAKSEPGAPHDVIITTADACVSGSPARNSAHVTTRRTSSKMDGAIRSAASMAVSQAVGSGLSRRQRTGGRGMVLDALCEQLSS